MVEQRYWSDNVNDPDRQRRKQAEFLVHRSCNWEMIREIAVINATMKARVEAIFVLSAESLRRPVVVHNDWYYH